MSNPIFNVPATTGLHMQLRDELEDEENKTTTLRKRYIKTIIQENIQLNNQILDIKQFHYKKIEQMEEEIDKYKNELKKVQEKADEFDSTIDDLHKILEQKNEQIRILQGKLTTYMYNAQDFFLKLREITTQ